MGCTEDYNRAIDRFMEKRIRSMEEVQASFDEAVDAINKDDMPKPYRTYQWRVRFTESRSYEIIVDAKDEDDAERVAVERRERGWELGGFRSLDCESDESIDSIHRENHYDVNGQYISDPELRDFITRHEEIHSNKNHDPFREEE